MNQELCCTNNVIAQIMIVFVTSLNLRRAQSANLRIYQSSSDAIILYDTMPASAPDKVVTFAGEVVFERAFSCLPTSIKPRATPGERLDLRTSSQPEEPFSRNEKEANTFLISSLTKEVLKPPKKSTMITDLIKNYSQENTE